MAKSHILNTLELVNSPNNLSMITKSQKDPKKLMSEEKMRRQKNIESFYSKNNLDKYLNNSFHENSQNKKYLQNKKEINHNNNFAENRTHFLYMKYDANKFDERVNNPINSDNQKKILETRQIYLKFIGFISVF